MATFLQERRKSDDRLADEESVTAPAATVQTPARRAPSTGYFYGTARGWSELGVFVRVPRDSSRVSDCPAEER